MPAREAGNRDVEKAAYYLALDGVTRHSLAEAVKAILQGALGHAFFPSPPELRMQCDRAMEHHVRMRDRVERRARIERDRIPDRRPLSDEERARQVERMRRFNRSIGRDPESEEADFRKAMEAKYGAEALAKVPDAPDTVPGFRRPAR